MALGFSTEILSFFLFLFGQRISGTTSCLLLFTKWHSADLQLPMPRAVANCEHFPQLNLGRWLLVSVSHLQTVSADCVHEDFFLGNQRGAYSINPQHGAGEIHDLQLRPILPRGKI